MNSPLSNVIAILLGGISLASGQAPAELGNQALARLGLVDVTAAPFNADPTGVADSSDAINAALLYGRENHMVTWLPAGDYKVSRTIELRGRDMATPDSDMNDYFCVLQGDTSVPGKRSRLILAPNSPGFASRTQVAMVVHAFYPSGSGFNTTGHFNQVVRNLDIVIGAGNPGAVGLRLQGAEGTLIEDVAIDATHGWKGVWGIPGSGGSTHRLTVTGGEIGVDLRGWNPNGSVLGVGTQPGPMISQLRLIGQTDTPLALRSRGSLVVVGAEIISDTALKAFSLQGLDANNPWASSLALVDATVDLTGPGAARSLIQQLSSGTVPGRGYTLHNVHVRGISSLDSVSKIPLQPETWTQCREVALSVQPVPYQGNSLSEPIIVDGQILPSDRLVDLVPGRAPGIDPVAYHGPGARLPSPLEPGIVNLLDFGADPAGVADSTQAMRAALSAGRDVLVPRGTFMISDTVYLKSDTRLIGIHPHLSQLRGRDTPSARFGGLNEGDAPAPMIVSPDDRNARTVIAMIGIEAPKAVRSHRRDPVLVYPLLWQSGRFSVIHHAQFSPYASVNWRLQNVMGTDFQLAQEAGPYDTGGLRFSSNDVLSRLFIEQLGGSQRLSMPFVKGGIELVIAHQAGSAFSLEQLELGKATFGPGLVVDVTITGIQTDDSILETSVSFDADWLDREAPKTASPGWAGLKRVVIRSSQPFWLDNVVSSLGTADMEKRRAFYVVVACEDMRLGFEHFPFAPVTHPQVVITNNGGGRWYNAFHHGDLWSNPEFSFIEVRDTHEPLNIYHWHLQHVHSDSQARFVNARYASVFGFKSEHNSRFLTVLDSDQIRLFGWGGLADAAVGGSHFRFENTPNLLHAAMAEEPHFIEGFEVWSNCDNPLIVHHVRLFDGIQEVVNGELTDIPVMARTILFKRGEPVAGSSIDSFTQWVDWMGYTGPDAAPEADPAATGYPNLLRYALRMDSDPWTGAPAPLTIEPAETGWQARVRRPVVLDDVTVEFLSGPVPGLRETATAYPVDAPDAGNPSAGEATFPMPGPRAFGWLEATSNP